MTQVKCDKLLTRGFAQFTLSHMASSKRLLQRVQESLGEPAAKGDGYVVYHGDSLSLMSRLPCNLFPLTVTSPPYNIGKEYETERPIEEYLDWCGGWIGEVHRMTQSDGAFWLNLGYVSLGRRAKAIPLPYLLWDRVPFHLIQEIVWNYGAGVAAKRSFSPRNEKFLWYVKNPNQYVFNLDAVRRPKRKVPKAEEEWQAEMQSAGEESYRRLAHSQGDLRNESEFEGANAASSPVPHGRYRANH